MSASDSIQLSVVFVQYDRVKYRGALERLLGILARLEGVASTLVVVDNAEPGDWRHEVSSNLTHLGGDNSAWEFSAFDRGVAYHEGAGHPADLYAFVTDAFGAYGDEYLSLIGEAAVRTAIDLEACVGWVDSFGEECEIAGRTVSAWVRTSFFLLPAAVVRRLLPLAGPLDPERVFGPGPDAPFAPGAPVSENLRAFLLTWLTGADTGAQLPEIWHSRFDLDAESFPFFRQKASAILREQLLSGRLSEAGVPGFDLRAVDVAVRAAGSLAALEPRQRARLEWLGWRDAASALLPRYNLERVSIPDQIRHGEAVALTVEGWVVTRPQARKVALDLGDAGSLGGACDIVRTDVEKVLQGAVEGPCGFRIEADLSHLPPGTYPLAWRVPGTGVIEDLGELRVEPRCEFTPEEVVLPASAVPGRPFPIHVEGRLETTSPLARCRVLWDARPTAIHPTVVELRRATSGLHRYRVLAAGAVDRERPLPQHRLRLSFETEDGGRSGWTRYALIAAKDGLYHSLAVREIGPWDPVTGEAEVHLRGAVAVEEEEASLVLLRGDRLALEEPLVVAAGSAFAWFEIRRPVRLSPGLWTFRLALRRGGGPPREFATWQDLVAAAAPVVHVDDYDVDAIEGSGSRFLIGLSGWVDEHREVEDLRVKLDGEEVGVLPVDHLRADVAEHFGRLVARRQGFQGWVPVEAEPGDHVLELETVRSGGGPGERASGRWRRTIRFEGRSLVASSDLDELESSTPRFWSSIRLAGTLTSPREAVEAALYVDGEEADRRQLPGSGDFELRAVPRRDGKHRVRVVLSAGDETIYDSGSRSVRFRRAEVPEHAVRSVERFLEVFNLRSALELDEPPAALARLLLERRRRYLTEYLEMFRQIDATLQLDGEKPLAPARPLPRPVPQRPLRVLFASWEVPSSSHGGGVWMVQLLKELARRHELTVVHSYGPGEERGIAEVKSLAPQVISVRRSPYHPDLERRRGSGFVPAYCPDLRAAIEAELHSGSYDLIDFQYVKMYEHRTARSLPQILTAFEEPFSAALGKASLAADDFPARLERLENLLDQFHYSAVRLPEAFSHLVAVTEEDAGFWRRFQRGTTVHVNTIGIDPGRFAPPEIYASRRAGPPTLVLLGNYRHPPNVDAAEWFAQRVLPEVRRRYPGARFVILGAHAPRSLQRLADAEPGIEVTGFVEDTRPYLWSATACVAPIFTGSGMRVKMLEAMASGAPVVGSALSVHGLGAKPGEHLYLADDAADFAAAVRRCIERPDEAARVGENGRRLVRERHSSAASARAREGIWLAALDAARQRARESCGPSPIHRPSG